MSVMKKKQTTAATPVRAPRAASPRKVARKEAVLQDAEVAAMVAEPVAAVTAAEPAPPEAAPVASNLMVLPENCTLRDALAMKAELMNLKGAVDAVTIEVSAVQRIETANLQVLAAFVRDRRSAGHAVRWSGESEAMSQAVRLLGLDAVLNYAATAPGAAA